MSRGVCHVTSVLHVFSKCLVNHIINILASLSMPGARTVRPSFVRMRRSDFRWSVWAVPLFGLHVLLYLYAHEQGAAYYWGRATHRPLPTTPDPPQRTPTSTIRSNTQRPSIQTTPARRTTRPVTNTSPRDHTMTPGAHRSRDRTTIPGPWSRPTSKFPRKWRKPYVPKWVDSMSNQREGGSVHVTTDDTRMRNKTAMSEDDRLVFSGRFPKELAYEADVATRGVRYVSRTCVSRLTRV